MGSRAFGEGSFYHSNTLDRTLTVYELKIPPEMLVGDTVGSEIQENKIKLSYSGHRILQ